MTLNHPIRKKILRLFIQKRKQTFTQVEQGVGLRANHVAYHLQQLLSGGLLRKTGRYYNLTGRGQQSLIMIGKNTVPVALPVVLLTVEHNNKVALIRRIERPYSGQLGLPGGRLKLGETLSEAAIRIAKEKISASVVPKAIGGIGVERLLASDGIAHSFLLVLVRCHIGKMHDKVRWYSLKNLPVGLISSDRILLQEKVHIPLRSFDTPESYQRRKAF
jgi:ADP-ribose pyrophosphatase YjhB (NUDIX family)